MHDQNIRAGFLAAIAPLAALAREEAHSRIAEALCDLGERSMRPKTRKPSSFAAPLALIWLAGMLVMKPPGRVWRKTGRGQRPAGQQRQAERRRAERARGRQQAAELSQVTAFNGGTR